MKRIALAAALVVSAAAFTTAFAASDPQAGDEPSARAERHAKSSHEDADGGPQRMAEGFFDRFRDGDRDGDGGRRHHRHHHWDDDDDDDDDHGSDSASRGGARSADPNAANAPVPDSGVFNGKARPKVEVQ